MNRDIILSILYPTIHSFNHPYSIEQFFSYKFIVSFFFPSKYRLQFKVQSNLLHLSFLTLFLFLLYIYLSIHVCYCSPLDNVHIHFYKQSAISRLFYLFICLPLFCVVVIASIRFDSILHKT